MTSRANTEEIWDAVDAKKAAFVELSDRVWATPELCFGEFKSVAEHKQLLETRGLSRHHQLRRAADGGDG